MIENTAAGVVNVDTAVHMLIITVLNLTEIVVIVGAAFMLVVVTGSELVIVNAGVGGPHGASEGHTWPPGLMLPTCTVDGGRCGDFLKSVIVSFCF